MMANVRIHDTDNVRIYLNPSCIVQGDTVNPCFFSFTSLESRTDGNMMNEMVFYLLLIFDTEMFIVKSS